MQAIPKMKSENVINLIAVPSDDQTSSDVPPAKKASTPQGRLGVPGPSAGDFTELGQHLASLYGLPYAPLMENLPAYEARRLLSFECARRWQVMPLAFDPQAKQLTIAVHDPVQMERIRKMYRFYMQSLKIDFRIASAPEIRAAFHEHFDEASGGRRRWLLRPLFAGDAPPRKKKQAPKRLTAVQRSVRGMQMTSASGTISYSQMSRSLLNAVAWIVTGQLKTVEPARLDQIRERVRYCHLLAAGLKLGPRETDGLILSAWISGSEQGVDLAAQLNLPYAIDAILNNKRTRDKETPNEADVLSLVIAYQNAKAANTAIGRDITLTRRVLRQNWAGTADKADKIEALLQILMDENFGEDRPVSGGKILIVDPAEVSRASFSPPLRGDGYEVQVAPGVHAADRKLKVWQPDLIMMAPALPDGDGIAYCEALKHDDATRAIPVIMVCDATQQEQMTQAFKAGADDVLLSPVNPELLFVRLQKLLMVEPQSDRDEADVRGRLTEMDFSDLVQVLSAGGKRVEINLRGEHGEGSVLIDGSRVLHAEAPGLVDADAFYEIMRWNGASFWTRHCETVDGETMNEAVMSLLMEGARRCDEHIKN
jgi:CheY-like chemotaxis protein